ncbi:MAG: PQQ-like beta-propeller repeat protein [Phycisphaerae bacterium]|jgi:outer membrane protein assembly factor BamB|nr:PQQ-like beta-propeller repeat protein [Phycisphaerae bacterium]
MKRRTVILSAVTLILLTAWPASSFAGEGWTTFRQGPERLNKSLDSNLMGTWPDGGPKLLWHAKGLGGGYATATVAADGTVYTAGDTAGKLHLFAINSDGERIWDVAIDNAWTKGPRDWHGARSTPTLDDGKVYVVSAYGKLGCYKAADGSELWTVSLPRTFGAKVPNWGYAESPLIHGDLCIVAPGGRSAAIAALNKDSGETVWKSPPFGGAQYGSNTLAKVGDVEMVVNGMHNGLLAVNAANGELLWTNGFAKGNTANCPTPVCSDGYVFWAVGYGKGAVCVKVEPDGDGVKATEVYRTKEMVNHHGGYVIDNGYVYGNHGGEYVCLDLQTGRKQWQIKGPGKGSTTWADGMLILYGERGGKVQLVAATSDEPTTAGAFGVDGSGPSWAHPVVVNGKLYLRYGENLYCFQVGK